MKYGHLPVEISNKATEIGSDLHQLSNQVALACSNWREHDVAEVGAALEEATEDMKRLTLTLDKLTRKVYGLLSEKKKAGTEVPA